MRTSILGKTSERISCIGLGTMYFGTKIYELGKEYNVPVFSTSSFRYTEPVLEISSGKKG